MMPGHNASLVSTSLWQTPQACTLTRTSPGPGFGISRSTISHGPWAFATCTTLIFFAFAAICPPQNEFRIDCAAPASQLGCATKIPRCAKFGVTNGAELSEIPTPAPAATQGAMLRLEN